MKSSRIPAFYRLTVEERRQKLAEALGLSPDDRAVLEAADALPLDVADIMVENAGILELFMRLLPRAPTHAAAAPAPWAPARARRGLVIQ